MSEHAFLQPSAAVCWEACALHPTMNKLYPELEDTAPAMEGTAAHWVFEQMVNGNDVKVDQVAPNGVPITEEMIDGALIFLERIGGANNTGFVETRVSMSGTIHKDNWGTPDFYSFDRAEKLIHVVDYKFGFGYVDAFENMQCINYVIGVCEKLNLPLDGDYDVRIEVVQPRCYTREGPLRIWETSLKALNPYFQRLYDAAQAAVGENPSATPGDHCEFCTGRHACEALQVEALRAADWSYEVVPFEIPVGPASRELHNMSRAFKLMEARITGLQEMLMAKLRAGITVPGFALGRGEGRLRWTKPPAEIAALGDLLRVDLVKPAVVTPRQAIKMGVSETIIAAVTETPVGEWKLVEEDLSKSRKVFGK